MQLFFSAPVSTWSTANMLRDYTDEEVSRAIDSVPTHYAGTFTEFYTDFTNGANVNGGSDSGAPSMSDTAGTGSWVSGTGVYTSTATTGTVTVGQFMSIYAGAATVPAYTSRITVVTGGSGAAWVITLSSTAFSGALPTTGAAFKAQVGGAWKGPNAASGFPFGYITNALTDAAGDNPRVNMKNNASYAITAAMTHALLGPIVFQGYTAAPGDGGKAIIDGGTSVATYILLTVSAGLNSLRDLIFQNNGGSGSGVATHGLSVTASCFLERVVVNNVRNGGFNLSSCVAVECEAYNCDLTNIAVQAFLVLGGTLTRCVCHDNPNCPGFKTGNGFATFIDCIADTNGSGIAAGFMLAGNGHAFLQRCVSYNNTTYGLTVTSTSQQVTAENCIFANNLTYGAINFGTNTFVRLINCAFYLNGTAPTGNAVDATGTITLSASPFTDPANGDFSLNTTAGGGAACRAAGRGAFTQISGDGYTKTTTSIPDVGATQNVASGGGGAVGGFVIGG